MMTYRSRCAVIWYDICDHPTSSYPRYSNHSSRQKPFTPSTTRAGSRTPQSGTYFMGMDSFTFRLCPMADVHRKRRCDRAGGHSCCLSYSLYRATSKIQIWQRSKSLKNLKKIKSRQQIRLPLTSFENRFTSTWSLFLQVLLVKRNSLWNKLVRAS